MDKTWNSQIFVQIYKQYYCLFYFEYKNFYSKKWTVYIQNIYKYVHVLLGIPLENKISTLFRGEKFLGEDKITRSYHCKYIDSIGNMEVELECLSKIDI